MEHNAPLWGFGFSLGGLTLWAPAAVRPPRNASAVLGAGAQRDPCVQQGVQAGGELGTQWCRPRVVLLALLVTACHG